MPTLPTPNMNLNLPEVGGELGPQYGSDNNAAFFQVDSHNHTAGQGVLIPTAGIDINTDLPFNGNNAISLNSAIFNNNSSPLPGSSPYLNAVYVSGGNLYYNDGVGNQVKITNNGSVNATSSGIVSGTASASFVGGVLVVNQAANTPGNIQAGSILIGNNVANSFFAQVNAPSSLSATYNITLPPVNNTSNTVFLTYDSSDNIGIGPNVSGGITLANLAAALAVFLVPTGAFLPFGGTIAPSGWLICDGSAVSRTTYSALFAVIGTGFGNGNGSTTFNLPPPGVFFRNTDPTGVNDPGYLARTSYAGGNSGANVGSFQAQQTAVNGLHDTGHAHLLGVETGETGTVTSGSFPYLSSVTPAQLALTNTAPEATATASIETNTANLASSDGQTTPDNVYATHIIKT